MASAATLLSTVCFTLWPLFINFYIRYSYIVLQVLHSVFVCTANAMVPVQDLGSYVTLDSVPYATTGAFAVNFWAKMQGGVAATTPGELYQAGLTGAHAHACMRHWRTHAGRSNAHLHVPLARRTDGCMCHRRGAQTGACVTGEAHRRCMCHRRGPPTVHVSQARPTDGACVTGEAHRRCMCHRRGP